ncbi:hypothetical protein [Nocardia arthritidis]|nr:hypothetical protein [Nocardia arthritidis]
MTGLGSGGSAEDLARFYEIAGSPGWHDIPQLIVTVVGRRPA